jgi:perosamine synthetase
MLELSPHARLRLYTRGSDYVRVLFQMADGQWRRGESVAELEHRLSEHLGAQYALAMPMARVGIYFAIRALIKPGQKVIMSPYTIADVVNMVLCAGGVPVFADIEAKTCNISPAEVQRLIDNDTGAVLVTHFYGCACDVESIIKICSHRNIPVIEDAAQAFGAAVGGKAVGTIGDVGIFSFGLYKHLTSFYGGLLVTKRKEIYSKVSDMLRPAPLMEAGFLLKKVLSGAITDFITWPPVFAPLTSRIFRVGFLRDIDAINNRLRRDVNPKKQTELPRSYLCRMSPLQARLIAEKLGEVDAHIDWRISVAKQYNEGLHDLSEILLPPLRLDKSHIYWYYTIQYLDRHELVKSAMRQGRDIAESYHRNCADLLCFAEYYRDCPVARTVARSLIYLPTYPGYPRHEIERNIASIRRFLRPMKNAVAVSASSPRFGPFLPDAGQTRD